MNDQMQYQNTAVFNTANAGLKSSTPVVLRGLKYDESTRSIVVRCSDASERTCRIDRMPGESSGEILANARALYAQLQGLQDRAVQFYVAGGNSSTRWFCAVEESFDNFLLGRLLFDTWESCDAPTFDQSMETSGFILGYCKALQGEGRHKEALQLVDLGQQVLTAA